jgi:hypothetical protein
VPCGGSAIKGLVIDPNGQPLASIDVAPVNVMTPNPFFRPAIAFNGAGYLVVWSEASGTVAVRMLADGTIVDTTPLLVSTQAGLGAVGCAAGTCLLVGSACTGPASDPCTSTQIVGVRVDATQGALDALPIPISTNGPSRAVPAATFDGQRFLIAWQQDDGTGPRLLGNWMALDGTVLLAAGVPISPDEVSYDAPALAGGGNGTSVVVYDRFDPAPSFDSERVRARFAGYALEVGKSCTTGAACTSGFCADGVCCATACPGSPCMACSVAAGAAVDGTCGPTTGFACDDGDPCTSGDTCNAGSCAGVPLACPPSDACHGPGSCDPRTGACTSPPALPNGARCSGGACTAGVCTAASDDIDADCGCKAVGDASGLPMTPALLLVAGALAARRRARRQTRAPRVLRGGVSARRRHAWLPSRRVGRHRDRRVDAGASTISSRCSPGTRRSTTDRRASLRGRGLRRGWRRGG